MQKLEVARILMNDVNFLIGNENIINAPLPTFSGEICEFLNDLSKEIMQSPESRLYPDLYSLGFWCRKGNIQKLKKITQIQVTGWAKDCVFILLHQISL